MRFLQLAVVLSGVILLAGSLAPRAQADQWNQKTFFTFSGPVEIPGFHRPTVLPAGTYEFKLLDSMSDRNIVQIFDKDQTHLYATILAIPDYRLTPTGKTVLTFAERPAGSPAAIKAWFYPGDLHGQEFVYPKSRAMELAKATNEPVLSMPNEVAENIAKPIKSGEEPAAVALEKAPLRAEEPNGGEAEVAAVVGTKPEGSAKLVAKNLPRTASDLPLAALCGSLLVGLGIGLRLFSRRFGQSDA
jgi:hypothetical protein